MRFAVNAEELPEVLDDESNSDSDPSRRRRAEANGTANPDTTSFVRTGSALDSAGSSNRGLALIQLPDFKLGNRLLTGSYIKLFWLGIGFRPPPDLTIKNIGDAICTSCGGGQGAMTSALEFVKGWPIVGEITGLLFHAHIHFIGIRADNGNRLSPSILSLIGKGGVCGSSVRGGTRCSKPTGPQAPPGRTKLQAAKDLGAKMKGALQRFLDSYKPKRLTYDLHIDTQFTTPDDPLDLGKLFSGQASGLWCLR